MRLLSPAKLNVHLRVARPSPDGFHPLLTWMCKISLFDTLTFERTNASGRIVLTADDPSLACDEGNLIVRAARMLDAALRDAGEASRLEESGLAIHLQKRIPIGGGLGGGSSNAATTLLALDQLWESRRGRDFLAEVAAKLGSDVPFFLHGSSSVCTGRGEVVRPIAPPAAGWACLCLPGLAMPTPQVYRQFDAMRSPTENEPLVSRTGSYGGETNCLDEPDWSDWAMLPADQLMSKLVNDLEPAAFALCPELREMQAKLERSIGRPVRMSGSGSTLFSLFDSEDEATQACRLGIRKSVVVRLCDDRWEGTSPEP